MPTSVLSRFREKKVINFVLWAIRVCFSECPLLRKSGRLKYIEIRKVISKLSIIESCPLFGVSTRCDFTIVIYDAIANNTVQDILLMKLRIVPTCVLPHWADLSWQARQNMCCNAASYYSLFLWRDHCIPSVSSYKWIQGLILNIFRADLLNSFRSRILRFLRYFLKIHSDFKNKTEGCNTLFEKH